MKKKKIISVFCFMFLMVMACITSAFAMDNPHAFDSDSFSNKRPREHKDDKMVPSPEGIVSPQNTKKQLIKEESDSVASTQTHGETSQRKHCFGLKEADPRKGTYNDSRTRNGELSIKGHSFQAWHKSTIDRLKPLTLRVRTALKKATDPLPSTNLLLYKIDLIHNANERVEVEDDGTVWVSGWPSGKNPEILSNKFRNEVNFRFISHYIQSFSELDNDAKIRVLTDKIAAGLCLDNDKHSFLIPQRLDHQKWSLERAREEAPYLNTKYLHTEQGLLLYLSSQGFHEKLEKTLKDNQVNAEEEAFLIINIASSRSVCLNCSDRLFRESEWGQMLDGLIKKTGNKLLKIYFLASAFEQHPDTDLAPALIAYYSDLDSQAQQEVGFISSTSPAKINFSKDLANRSDHSSQLLSIGHAMFGK